MKKVGVMGPKVSLGPQRNRVVCRSLAQVTPSHCKKKKLEKGHKGPILRYCSFGLERQLAIVLRGFSLAN